MLDPKGPFYNLLDLIKEVGSPSVLIVDDEDKNIQILGTFFNKHSKYIVNVAINGKKAVESLEKKHFDLILMDVNMPIMNGFDAVKEMKEKGLLKATTIIFLSAQKDLSQILIGLNLGVPDYITKPFHLEELNSKIEYHIRVRLYEKFILKSLNETEGLINNISQSIFCINHIGKIQKPVSDYSKTIFDKNIEGEVFYQLGFKEFKSAKFKKEFEKKIINAFSCSKVTWTITEKELHKKFLLMDSEEKVLKANYIPLWSVKEEIEKIMITLEDITQKEKFSKKKSTYYIGQIAKIIGLNPDTLKTWVKRYNLISETKDDKGSFLYTHEHLERFDLYKNLVDKNYKIGKLIKLTDSDLKKEAEKFDLQTIDIESQNESKISKDEIIHNLLLLIKKKNFFLFSREVSKLKLLYKPDVLSLEIIPVLINSLKEKLSYENWDIMEKKIFKEFFSKAVKEIIHGDNSYLNSGKQKVILGQFLPKKNSLNFNQLLLLIHSYTAETYYFEDDILSESNKSTINYIEPRLIILSLEGEDEITMNSLLKSIKNIKNSLLGTLIIFNKHKFIKSDELKTEGHEVVTQLSELKGFFPLPKKK